MSILLNYLKFLPPLRITCEFLVSSQKEIPQNQLLSNNQQGQSLVEFILLFLVITIISTVFIRGLNTNLADYWVAIVNIIIDDPNIQVSL